MNTNGYTNEYIFDKYGWTIKGPTPFQGKYQLAWRYVIHGKHRYYSVAIVELRPKKTAVDFAWGGNEFLTDSLIW